MQVAVSVGTEIDKFCSNYAGDTGIILETEGSVRKTQKREPFSLQKN